MKKSVVLCLIASLLLAGCNSVQTAKEQEIILETQDVSSITNASENEEKSIVEEIVKENPVNISEAELEEIINKKVEEKIDAIIDKKIAELNVKDGLDGKNGEPGRDGVGIAGITVDANGDLIVALTNGVISNVGHVKGDKGDTGATGPQGEKGDRGDDGSDGKVCLEKTESSEELKKAEEAAKKAEEEAKKAAEEAAAAAAALAGSAPQAASGAMPASGAWKYQGVTFTANQVAHFHALWDYTGDAAEMATHHSAGELQKVCEVDGIN